ncbi:MAG: ABC transporter ATP-binding protein [Planctomycetota bacterium]
MGVPLELESVGKTFANGKVAVQRLDLTVAAGGFCSILGRSGCGKSTALRIVAGLVEASEGRVSFGEIGSDTRPRVGMVFQESALMPWRRVWGNVYLPLQVRGVSKKEAREQVDNALALVGLQDESERYPRQLSGGMKMRVSIARAIVQNPSVLLMDEPFGALDEITRWRLNDELLKLWSLKGWTVLFVTHSVFESVYLSQKVAVMSDAPGCVSGSVDVGAAYPRGDAFRVSSEYQSLCSRVSGLLRPAEAVSYP